MNTKSLSRRFNRTMEFSLNGTGIHWIQQILINHWSMNWAQFKDPVSHMCLAGAVVASWSLTQEVAGWQVWAFYCNDKYFCHRIQQKHLGKLIWNRGQKTCVGLLLLLRHVIVWNTEKNCLPWNNGRVTSFRLQRSVHTLNSTQSAILKPKI